MKSSYQGRSSRVRVHRRLERQTKEVQDRLGESLGPAMAERLQADLESLRTQSSEMHLQVVEIEQRIEERHQKPAESTQGPSSTLGHGRMAHESQRDFLLRTGKITPFSRVAEKARRLGATLGDAMLDAEESDEDGEMHDEPIAPPLDEVLSHQHLRRPGFAEDEDGADVVSAPQAKRRRLLSGRSVPVGGRPSNPPDPETSRDSPASSPRPEEMDENAHTSIGDVESDDGDAADRISSDESVPVRQSRRKRRKTPAKPRKDADVGEVLPEEQDLRRLDDGNEKVYQARLKQWTEKRRCTRDKCRSKQDASSSQGDDAITGSGPEGNDTRASTADAELDEWLMPHPTLPDTTLEGGLKLPGDIYPSLFDYQKTGVRWLWELYQRNVGGIVGDEMGLGKTIQVISFLAGLHHSGRLNKPVIVVTPATVMTQWVKEFHRWWPPLRVSIFHTSGSGMLKVRGEDRIERELERSGRRPRQGDRRGRSNAAKVLQTVLDHGHVLITTYAGLQTYGDLLIPVDWAYAVLDEGHKIRNPNASITIYCKELRTSNRIILSGTPMQNTLSELWSLFDFVFPMRLGTLVSFRLQFEAPIKIGGYARANNLEVRTATKCAETLKEVISPYLLQRLKADVASDLPKKSERVLFCRLTDTQRCLYREYLRSGDVKKIVGGTMRTFSGIERLRKICNHPDLDDRRVLSKRPGYDYGDPAKSGKMGVVKGLLELWRTAGHKALLFAQQKIMLDILEKFVKSLDGLEYLRMDGDTPVDQRQTLVDGFNNSSTVNVFLLTTKVGGLGVNLTGANRVIIFDPDWNPSTDSQARERAWRLGQKKEVVIYRLMTHGTIEEKIYHRQLFKQFLANKILRDPNQQRRIPMGDLHDLFRLDDDEADDRATETGRLFEGAETRFSSDAQDQRRDEKQRPIGNGVDVDQESAAGGDDDAGQLQALAGVAGLENLRAAEDEASKAGDESRVVDGILATSGVKSALEHDIIVNGKVVLQGDRDVIEREAKRVAAHAAKELQKAEKAARQVPVGTPTWTGEVGVAGRPDAPYRVPGAGRGPTTSNSLVPGLPPANLLTQIRDFIRQHNNEVRSQMLVDHFGHACRNSYQTAQFKEMLDQIATLEKAGRMRGKWVLKEEYRG